MQPSLSLLNELIPLLDEYQAETQKGTDLGDFVLWLNKRVIIEKRKGPEQERQTLDSYITANLWRMHKYAKHYARLALQDSLLKGLDDFVMLVALLDQESYTKSEIIMLTLTEFQTGIGILKRLCKLDLLEEFEDEQDKRSRRVRLRPAGRQLLGELFYKMTQLSQLVTADLDDQEKFELLSLLEHLNRFHLKLYHDKALDSLDELVKILPPPAT